ncbi:hypothetical protein RB598_006391 [Gaeumannomyces tritici]
MASTKANSPADHRRVGTPSAGCEGDGHVASPPPPPPSQTTLADNILFYQPASAANSTSKVNLAPSDDAPALVVLCTWLGGDTHRRIARYVAGYQQLWPRVAVLVVRTVLADMSVRPFAALRARLAPARDAISRVLSDAAGSGKGLLLHAFSNGGASVAVQLARSLGQSPPSILDGHLRLVVLDCCPGDGSFQQTYQAALRSLPPRMPLRAVGMAAVFGMVAVVTGLQAAGVMGFVQQIRRHLNDASVVPAGADRLYLFSRADSLVGAADVLQHAREATRGLAGKAEVGGVIFEKAEHCALPREDANRYWNAIKDAWGGKVSSMPLGAPERASKL